MVKKPYEAPEVKVVGSLQELTLRAKDTTRTPDGLTYHGVVLTT